MTYNELYSNTEMGILVNIFKSKPSERIRLTFSGIEERPHFHRLLEKGMKMVLMLSMLPCMLSACSRSNDRSEIGNQVAHYQPTSISQNLQDVSELTPQQQSAFDALNTLQVSTDEMNRLYSTFAGIIQPCYPPDTSLTISQTELLIAMKQFVTRNCKRLSAKEQDELASTSVLAQEEYTLSLCLDNSANVTYENGAPMKGTWVIQSVLDRRDVILVW